MKRSYKKYLHHDIEIENESHKDENQMSVAVKESDKLQMLYCWLQTVESRSMSDNNLFT